MRICASENSRNSARGTGPNRSGHGSSPSSPLGGDDDGGRLSRSTRMAARWMDFGNVPSVGGFGVSCAVATTEGLLLGPCGGDGRGCCFQTRCPT